ncbi:MAG: PD-(D/E)XK nuclease family protein [Candidatus Micrarchaeia archaeon]
MIYPYLHRHQTYVLANGSIVPSVTQILQAVIGKPGLLVWANGLGLQGVKLEDSNSHAFGIGTLLHALIEGSLRGEEVSTEGFSEEQIKQAQASFAQFLRWKDGKQIKPIFLEKPFVSEQYKYGGTIDALLEIDGSPTLVDWKTSNSISLDYKLQLAAYLILLEEHGVKPERVALLRLPKDGSEYEYFEASAESHNARYREPWLKALGWYYALQGML